MYKRKYMSTYRVYIVTDTPETKSPGSTLPSITEYYPDLNIREINNKIDRLNEQTSPITNKQNCLEWRVDQDTINMTVIDNNTNETIETANFFFLKS